MMLDKSYNNNLLYLRSSSPCGLEQLNRRRQYRPIPKETKQRPAIQRRHMTTGPPFTKKVTMQGLAFLLSLTPVHAFFLGRPIISQGCVLSRQLQVRQGLATVQGESGNASATTQLGCPFSKVFPKYRIDLTRIGKDDIKKPLFSIPFISSLHKSSERRNLKQQYSQTHWIEQDKGDLDVFVELWCAVADLSAATSSQDTSSMAVAVEDSSKFRVVRHWLDLLEWMQAQHLGGGVRIDGTILATDGDMIVLELKRAEEVTKQPSTLSTVNTDPDILTERTQAWVKRILVEQGICPFTKSVKISGQGLGDLGIPVARIDYCSSRAQTNQIALLMADTWKSISNMVAKGDRGKQGISSILLAAPGFDEDFDLWSGPIFAMLEAGVVATRLEPKIGVVCFHPRYATPDGSSFPGFGHMHSVPRLQKWLREHDPAQEEQLTVEEIAAGGAWQRRTPHATINVLRAEQLAAAEGRRVTGELYTENIRKLVGKPDGIGTPKLLEDLERERRIGL